jgi:hypothetical protein
MVLLKIYCLGKGIEGALNTTRNGTAVILFQYQVVMIGHKTIGNDGNEILLGILVEQGETKLIIFF